MVFQIPCECGSVYIGETGRQLKICIAEHKAALRQANSNIAIASHEWNSDHTIQWSETSVPQHDVIGIAQ